jgi:hypothetical protein
MTNATDGSRTFPIFTRTARTALSRQTGAEFLLAFDKLLSDDMDAAIALELDRDGIAHRGTTCP